MWGQVWGRRACKGVDWTRLELCEGQDVGKHVDRVSVKVWVRVYLNCGTECG